MRSMKIISGVMVAAFTLVSTVASAQADKARCLADVAENILLQEPIAVADIICDDVRAHGVSIGAAQVHGAANGASQTYRVKLRTLGDIMILTLSHEGSSGAILRSEHLQLEGLEELPAASLRLVKTLLEKPPFAEAAPLAETAPLTTVSHDETRLHDKRHGEFIWGVSVGGLTLNQPFTPMVGMGLHAVYETFGAALTVNAAYYYKDMDADSIGFNLSVGGRKIFGETNTAFYAGGGIAWSGYTAYEFNEDPPDFFHEKTL